MYLVLQWTFVYGCNPQVCTNPPPNHPLQFSPPIAVVVYGSITITNQHFLDVFAKTSH